MGRFSIAGLMAAVLVCGVAGAALKNASDAWAGVLLLLTLFFLGVSLLGILHRAGGRRAFWQGFAIFGWGYLLLAQAPWLADHVGPRLPTTLLLGYLHAKLSPSPEAQVYGTYIKRLYAADSWTAGGGTSGIILTRPAQKPPILLTDGSAQLAIGRGILWMSLFQSNVEQFQRVGHCLFALLAAVTGAGMARWFHRTNREVPPLGGGER